jgi:hypothetical protein
MAGADLEFHFATPSDEERFIRTYLVDAWDRFEASEFFETGWFWPYGTFAEYESGPDGGFLRIVFEGDPDAFVAAENAYWDEFDDLQEWTVTRYEEEGYESLLAQQRDAKGETAGERDYRLKPLTTRFILAYVQAFTEPLPLLTDDSWYGYWVVIHYAMVQAGYDWYDETDACLHAMQNRLKSIAGYHGAEAAREEYTRLLTAWEAHQEELETWLEESPTGHLEEP